MTIRSATANDLDAIADLAQDQRIRQQGWDPAYWALTPNARDIHPLFLRWSVDAARSVAMVVTRGEALVAYAIAAPLPLPNGTTSTWVVDDVGVAAAATWRTAGLVAIAAVAGRARQLGATRIVVPCATSDRARRAAFESGGLDLNCWYRHVRLDEVQHVAEPVPRADDEPGLPLPHLHGLASMVAGSTSVTASGAHALLTPPIAAPPVYRAGSTALADPVVADGAPGLWRGLCEVEATARARGDVALVVVVGPGEEPLDAALDERGYGRPVEWWTFRPT